MKNFFQREKGSEGTGTQGLVAQLASAMAMLGLCYAAMPVFAEAGKHLLNDAIPSAQAAPDMPAPAPKISLKPANDTAVLLMAVSPATPDRHWCLAEAFNSALEHRESPLKRAAMVVKQSAYTGYCPVQAGETNLKTASAPTRSRRQCTVGRT